jgi:hypothetical protein
MLATDRTAPASYPLPRPPEHRSVRRCAHDMRMYIARLVCSDAACAEEALAEAQTLEELDTFVCDCGGALAIVGWPDHVEEPAATAIVIPLGRRRRPAGELAA